MEGSGSENKQIREALAMVAVVILSTTPYTIFVGKFLYYAKIYSDTKGESTRRFERMRRYPSPGSKANKHSLTKVRYLTRKRSYLIGNLHDLMYLKSGSLHARDPGRQPVLEKLSDCIRRAGKGIGALWDI